MQKDKDGNIIFSKEEIEADQKAHNVTQIKPVEYIPPIALQTILADKPPEKRYALYPILPVQGIAFVFAAAGVGKTLFTLNAAYAIASGGNFLKYSAPKPLKVLYIDGEMAYIDIHTRIMQINKQQGALDFPENFHIYTPDKFIPIGWAHPIRIPKIDTLEGQIFYEIAIEKEGFDVIVFDNLTALSTIDLNSGEEYHIINEWLLSLRAKGKTTIVVHHAGKDKESYRGSSHMIDSIDTAISLQGIDETLPDENIDQPETSKRFKIIYQKNRSFYGKDAFPYEVMLANDKWIYRTMERSITDRLIDCLAAKMNQRDIAKELEISQSTVHRMVRKGKKDGLIKDPIKA